MNAMPVRAWDLLITAISPVHMGTGRTFEPTEAVLDDASDVLCGFDPGDLDGALGEAACRELLKIVSGRPDPALVAAVRRFFHDRRDDLVPSARRLVPVAAEIASHCRRRIDRAAGRIGPHPGRAA